MQIMQSMHGKNPAPMKSYLKYQDYPEEIIANF